MVRISRVVKVHTLECSPLLVDCDRWCDSTFVDVFSPIYSFSPLLVHRVLPHRACSRIFQLACVCVLGATPTSEMCLSSTSRKAKERPICSLEHSGVILRFCHLSSVTSYSFLARRKQLFFILRFTLRIFLWCCLAHIVLGTPLEALIPIVWFLWDVGLSVSVPCTPCATHTDDQTFRN